MTPAAKESTMSENLCDIFLNINPMAEPKTVAPPTPSAVSNTMSILFTPLSVRYFRLNVIRLSPWSDSPPQRTLRGFSRDFCRVRRRSPRFRPRQELCPAQMPFRQAPRVQLSFIYAVSVPEDGAKCFEPIENFIRRRRQHPFKLFSQHDRRRGTCAEVDTAAVSFFRFITDGQIKLQYSRRSTVLSSYPVFGAQPENRVRIDVFCIGEKHQLRHLSD